MVTLLLPLCFSFLGPNQALPSSSSFPLLKPLSGKKISSEKTKRRNFVSDEKKIICLKLGEKKFDPFQLFSKKGKIGSFSFRNFLGFCEKKVECGSARGIGENR